MNASIIIDIETLSRRSNAIVTEVSLIAFDRETFAVIDTITLRPCIATQLRDGRHFEAETLDFHLRQDTLPEHFTGTPPLTAAMTIGLFIERARPSKVWIWGKDFDRPILESFYRDHRLPLPWKYYQTACARDVWNLAFPQARPAKRPHEAEADALASLNDLKAALTHLNLPTAA